MGAGKREKNPLEGKGSEGGKVGLGSDRGGGGVIFVSAKHQKA
jgi:hypothetical protein